MGLFKRWRRGSTAPASAPDAPPRLLTYQVGNLQGQGTRSYQEDSFAFANAMDVTEIRRRGLLAVVADGMGGLEDGRLVSQAAVAGLLAGFGEMDRSGDLAVQLRDCVLNTGEALYQRFQGAGGTTLVACLVFQEMLYWISVGDSFLYLKRGPGLFRLNREHNYRAQLYLRAVREGRLSAEEADRDPDGHRLSQFLGRDVVDDVDYSLHPLPLEDGDTLLLCSDGVGGVLDERVLMDCLEGCPPQEACARIDGAVRALGRVNQDNYTALVVACGY